MKFGILITTCCIGTLAFADPSITDVTAKQRYPWNGKVDITYTTSGIEAAAKQKGWITSLKVTAKDNDTDTTYTATSLTGDTSFADGSHALVWDMTAQGLTFKSTNVAFDVTCVTKDALYCVIDLSGGSTATSYPVTYLSEIPGGSWSDEYKTTKLVLRRIDPGTCVVTVDKPYYIGVFEMTQKQYELVMGSIPSSSSFDLGDKKPVVKASYVTIRGNQDGNSFIGILRSRTGLCVDLPTGSQWMYACRSGTTTDYSFGQYANGNYMWYSDNSGGYLHDVGTREQNGWGLYDMHGNAWEWSLEWNSVDDYWRLYGGGFSSDAEYCKSYGTYTVKPSSGYYDRCPDGFRLIMNLSE